MAKGVVTELRGSLGLLETARYAAHSELHEAQRLMVGAAFPLPSFPHPHGVVSCCRPP